MADVFVSYARTDKPRVAPLVAAIEARGWSVWWDPEITPGQEFDQQIGVELKAAAAVLVVGLLRVIYFEKGAHYYWHDTYFIVKFSAFIAAGLISIYPTVTFLSWGSSIKAGVVPTIAPERYQRVRLCLMLELTAIVVILLCAPLMARGFGAFG